MNQAQKQLLRTGTPIYLRDLKREIRAEYRDDPAVKRAGETDEVVIGVFLDRAITEGEYDKL